MSHSQHSLKIIWAFKNFPSEDPQEPVTHKLWKIQSKGRSFRIFPTFSILGSTLLASLHHCLLPEVLWGYTLIPGNVSSSSGDFSPHSGLPPSHSESVQTPPPHRICPTLLGLLHFTHHLSLSSFIYSTWLRAHLQTILSKLPKARVLLWKVYPMCCCSQFHLQVIFGVPVHSSSIPSLNIISF